MIKTIEKELDRKALSQVIGGLMMTPDMEGYESYQLSDLPTVTDTWGEPDCQPFQYC